jgi:hypothetical protein
MSSPGSQHAPLVRELFLNPVIAPDTGAVRHAGKRGLHAGFSRLTIRGRIHKLPRHVAGEAEYELLQVPCPRDFQLLAATQV